MGSAGIDNSGDGNTGRGKKEKRKKKASLLCLLFSVLCNHIVPHLKKKKECKGIKSAMNITGLYSHFWISSDLGCVHRGDKFSCASSERLFLRIDEFWKLRCVALGWFQRQI